MIYYKAYNQASVDISVFSFGTQKCAPGHYYGYAIRKNHLMHYIHSGRGIYICNGVTYNLSAGQAFLILPGKTTYYKADDLEPWEYSWVSFSGASVEALTASIGFSAGKPVIEAVNPDTGDAIFRKMRTYSKTDSYNTGITGLLLCFFHESSVRPDTTGTMDAAKGYVERIKRLISSEYHHSISVSGIASSMNLDRCYMSSLFKKETGIPLQEYIIRFRVDKARMLLEQTSLSIKDIAASVGYGDQLGFSKIFRIKAGVSPKHYRTINRD